MQGVTRNSDGDAVTASWLGDNFFVQPLLRPESSTGFPII
jgi:hypothetical protein